MGRATLDAGQVLALLAARHKGDVFVPECKTGETIGSPVRILDAWAMGRTWSPIWTHGYEIKVSRADFAQDQKWVEYLPYCHHFSFVCPSGMIRSSELPEGVGLLWASANGTRVAAKTRAVRRPVDPARLTQIMAYALMSRSRIVASTYYQQQPEPIDKLEVWRQHLARAEERSALAALVRGHVRTRIDAATERARKAEESVGWARGFAERLAKLGIVWNADADDWTRLQAEQQLGALDTAIHPRTRRMLHDACSRMIRALDSLPE